MSLKTLTEWMTLLCASDRRFDGGDFSVDVHGAGDASYLVLEREVSRSPHVCEQYVLHPLPGANPLYQQVRFLAECGFDLQAVSLRLAGADYAATPVNDVARFESVEVARYRIRAN